MDIVLLTLALPHVTYLNAIMKPVDPANFSSEAMQKLIGWFARNVLGLLRYSMKITYSIIRIPSLRDGYSLDPNK